MSKIMIRKTIISSILILSLHRPIDMHAQENTKAREAEIGNLVKELYKDPWEGSGAFRFCVSANFGWVVWLDGAMKRIIEMGPTAQETLLKKLSDPTIKDKVMILLGGLGDERVIGPIIDAM